MVVDGDSAGAGVGAQCHVAAIDPGVTELPASCAFGGHDGDVAREIGFRGLNWLQRLNILLAPRQGFGVWGSRESEWSSSAISCLSAAELTQRHLKIERKSNKIQGSSRTVFGSRTKCVFWRSGRTLLTRTLFDN